MSKHVQAFKQHIETIRSHQGVMRYGKNTAWLMGEKVLRMFVGLFVGIWVARYLGPEQFGLLSYAQSFVFLFTAVATLGLDGIVVRELVRDDSQRDVLLGTAFTLKLVGSILILPLLWLGVQFTSNDGYTNLLIFIIASATIWQSFNVIDFYYQSTVMSKYVALANTISLLLSSIIKVVLILKQAPLLAFAMMTVFDALVLSAGLGYFYLKKTQHSFKAWRFDGQVARRLLTDSWPLIISSVMVSLYMKIDQVMIKEMLDNNAVGQYAAAVRLSEAWYFVPVAICSSVFPAIINAKKVSEALYYQRLQRLYSLMIWLGIAVALPVTFLSSWLIDLLYGSAYAEASSVLMVHVWAGIIISLGVARGRWIIIENFQKYTYIFLGVSAIVNVVGNILLIKSYLIVGAAFSTLLAQFIGTIIIPFIIKDTRMSIFMIVSSIIPRSFKNEHK